LIFSHGFDEEEVFARRGAGTIAPFLEKRYGKDGILMVIDEGSGTSDDVCLDFKTVTDDSSMVVPLLCQTWERRGIWI
jgi:hypothetical protein